jgi:predicted extracellular nuclease
MKTHFIAWWNVENLFAVEHDPTRSDKLARVLGPELVGWNNTVLNQKLTQLASVIGRLNQGTGPDILGIGEVESRQVLEQLIQKLAPLQRAYQVAHADTQDQRGIDVAFIYDSTKYKVLPEEVFNHFILRRNATRDLVQVNFYTIPDNRRLVLIGNHWPARLGGELESEPYRIIAAETLAYWHERIIQIHGKDQAVIAMGDFNDEPFSRSMVEYALCDRNPDRVKSARTKNPYFYNLMWERMGRGEGTHYFGGTPTVLDQILINRPLLRIDSPFQWVPNSLNIIKYPDMLTKSGEPKRFSRPSEPKDFDPTGFSDHLPLSIVINEGN